jgi:hypothetical protein
MGEQRIEKLTKAIWRYGIGVILLIIIAFLAGKVPVLLAQPLTPTAALMAPPTPTQTPVGGGKAPDAINVTKTIQPVRLSPGEEAIVTIVLQPKPFKDCLGIAGGALDAFIIVDNSAAAGQGPGSKLEREKEIAQSLMDQLAAPYEFFDAARRPQKILSRVGILTTQRTKDGIIKINFVELSEDYTNARNTVANLESLEAGIAPRLRSGIVQVLDEFKLKARSGVSQLLFLILHDDKAFTEEAFRAADEARNAGIQIYILGVGTPKEIPPAKAERLAGGADRFLMNPSPEELRRLLIKASGGSLDLAAKDFEIVDTFNPPGAVEILPHSLTPSGELTRDGRIRWLLPEIKMQEIITLTFRVRATQKIIGQVVSNTPEMSYICCKGCLLEHISVPVPGSIIGPASGAEISVTPMPAPALTITPTPTPVITGTQIILSWRIFICLLLPLLLLPLLLYFIIKRVRSGEKETPRPTPSAPIKPTPVPVKPPEEPIPKHPVPGETRPGVEGTDEAMIKEIKAELLGYRRLRGRILTQEKGLSTPWPVEVHLVTNSEELSGLKLRDKGEEFYWHKEDGSGVQMPMATLEKALTEVLEEAKKNNKKCSLVIVWGTRPADNLELRVETEALQQRGQVVVRALYREPIDEAPQPLAYYLHLELVDKSRRDITLTPILEQNLRSSM